MWRHYSFHRRSWTFRSARPIRRFVILSAALALCLSAVVAFSQDTPPPPPPDTQADAQPGQPAQPNPDQNTVRAVRLSDVEGKVQVFQGDQLAFDQALPNMPAVEAMRLVTGDNGRVEIEFEDGSVARVTPNSSIRLTQLRRSADGTPSRRSTPSLASAITSSALRAAKSASASTPTWPRPLTARSSASPSMLHRTNWP
jgi:hypothetical protein